MNDFNKITFKQGAIMFSIALVLFFTIIMVVEFCKHTPSEWYVLIFPVIAEAYGCYSLVKKYWPKNNY